MIILFLFLFLIKVGWNFLKMYFLLWYFLKHKKTYPHGVDLYLFVEWVLLLFLVVPILLMRDVDLPFGLTGLLCLFMIISSYVNGLLVIKFMGYIDRRLKNGV